MHDDDGSEPQTLEEFFMNEFMPSFAQMQSRVMANQFILVELISDVAKAQPDSKKYLDSLYERVIARQEQRPLKEQGKSDENFREAVTNMFSKAARRL
ncbi:MAG: hypothetical protein GVY13_01665 [Alphaproteobacteria bacterium]|jgi:hypothetical protein|nr:hypothetical protein [Alphaproteobacteria bacterium]